MKTCLYSIYLTIFSGQLHLFQAAEIVLAAKSTSIKAGLTKKLQMRCSLRLNRATDVTLQSGAKQFNETVNSISVIRDSKVLVAKISAQHPKIVSDAGTITAQGNLTAKRSYLQVSWTKPGIRQSGIYTCEIKATDSAGRDVVYRSNIYVCYQRPNEEDIVQYIIELEARLWRSQVAAQRRERRLKRELRDVRIAFNNSQSNLQGLFDNLRNVDINSSAALQRLQTEASILRADVTAIQHSLRSYVVEEGLIYFGNSAYFEPFGPSTRKQRIVYVRFTRYFSKVPTVISSLQELDANYKTNTRFRNFISGLTTTGFNLHCETWADTQLNGIAVKWTASIP